MRRRCYLAHLGLRGDGAGPICMALRNHPEILSHRSLDLMPFLQQLACSRMPNVHVQFTDSASARLWSFPAVSATIFP
jgi:hypothetical protein